MMCRAILGAAVLLVSASAAFGCGTERWQVKTGTDRDARSVTNLPKPTSIGELTSIVAPPDARRNSPFPPTELRTFQVTGTLWPVASLARRGGQGRPQDHADCACRPRTGCLR